MAAASVRPVPKKSARKSANGSGAAQRRGRPFTGADDPRNGRGPAKGAPNAGRPPDEHREFCRQLLADPAAEAAVKTILADPGHAAFAAMWRAVADRAYGKPAQPLVGPNGGPMQFERVPGQLSPEERDARLAEWIATRGRN